MNMHTGHGQKLPGHWNQYYIGPISLGAMEKVLPRGCNPLGLGVFLYFRTITTLDIYSLLHDDRL